MNPHSAMMARSNAWANARLYAEARAVSDESYRKARSFASCTVRSIIFS
jgi:uncharacterized damage-inducible protein DinB